MRISLSKKGVWYLACGTFLIGIAFGCVVAVIVCGGAESRFVAEALSVAFVITFAFGVSFLWGFSDDMGL